MSKRVLRWMLLGLGLGWSLLIATPYVSAQEPHWTYEGPEGPEHWGELSPDYALCSAGKEQSPVDIPSNAALNSANLTYSYQPSAVNIFNTGHTVQVNYDQGSTLTLENGDYQLVQFHFHAHSEHTKHGIAAPLELHLVHRNAAGQLAVVGVWMEAGAENAAFKPVFDHLPTTTGDPSAVPNVMVDAAALLPAERAYYRYNGSLTTPSCAEGVKWVMLDRPVSVSQDQINAYTTIFSNNARPTQPLNARSFLGNAAPTAQPLPTTGGASSPLVLLGGAGIALIIGGGLLRSRHSVSIKRSSP